MASSRSIFIGLNSGSSVVPSTTAADYIETLFTSESVAAAAQTTQDDTFSASRQPRGSVRTGFNVGGALQGRMRYGAYDHIMESALFSADWEPVSANVSPTLKLTGTVEVDHSTKTIVATAGAPFTDLAVGDWIRLEKTGYANTGICFRISVWTDASTITYDSWSKTPTSDGSGVASVVVRSGERITVGTQDRLHTYVKKLSQAGSDIYQAFLGVQFDQIGVQLTAGELMSFSAQVRGRKLVPDFDGTFMVDSNGDIVGSGGTSVALATYLASGFTAAPTTSVLSTASASTGSIMLDGVPSLGVGSYDLQLANNIQGEQTIFVFGDAYVEPGVVAMTGNFSAVFDGTDLLEKFVDDQTAALAVYMVGSDSKGYIFDNQAVRLGNGQNDFNNDALVKLAFTWSAEVDSVTSRAFQIIRFDAS